MKNLNKRGFTLIEMLIVVVIIGILAAALIPRLTSVKDKANDSARKVNLQQLTTAMSSYNLDNGILYIASSTGADTNSLSVQSALKLGGMKTIPGDPSNTLATIYGNDTTGYVYMSATKGGVASGGFVFISRVETQGAANWVENGANLSGSMDIDNITPCSSVVLTGTAVGNCSGPASKLRFIIKY